MKKQTKKSLTRKLDKECSRIVRARGSCAKCRKSDYEHLEAAHIFSRKIRSTRWDIENNILCLCDGCHFWAHANPVLFTEFVRQHLGILRYEILKSNATAIKQWKIWELEDLLQTLKETQ